MPSYLLWCSQITRSSSSEVKWMIREKSRQTLQTHTEDKSVATSVTHHFSWQCLTAEFPQDPLSQDPGQEALCGRPSLKVFYWQTLSCALQISAPAQSAFPSCSPEIRSIFFRTSLSPSDKTLSSLLRKPRLFLALPTKTQV